MCRQRLAHDGTGGATMRCSAAPMARPLAQQIAREFSGRAALARAITLHRFSAGTWDRCAFVFDRRGARCVRTDTDADRRSDRDLRQQPAQSGDDGGSWPSRAAPT